MSAVDVLAVRTQAGLSLELTYHRTGHAAGEVSATLNMPESLAPRSGWVDRQCAFLAGGLPGDAVRVEARGSKHFPPTLWMGSAAIYIQDDTAASVQAWLDSRPRPDTLPRDIATPAAPELQA